MVRPLAMRMQVGADHRLALRIECAGRLVEDAEWRIVDQRACDRQPLLLSAREVGRTFLNVGLVAVRHPLDEFLGAGETRGTHRRRKASGRGVRR